MKKNPNKIVKSNKQNIINGAIISLFFIFVLVFCYIINYSLIIPFVFLILGFHIFFLKKACFKFYIHLGLLLTLILFCTEILTQYTSIPSYYIPVAAIAMLTMLLFSNLHLVFLMSFISSVLVSLVVGGGIEMMLTFFLGSLVGAYSVRNARTRGQLLNAVLFIGLTHLVCLFLFNPQISTYLQKEFLETSLYALLANGLISVVLVVALLKIFESLFGVLTNYTLLELADFNHPLLRRISMEAAGTWNHSLVVSLLSEAAANEIGANGLLTRVGSYYHDIGKMANSEYFTENQFIGANKHDEIVPSMSRLVILNHVKGGIELAKKYKLNQKIIDFIPQHHGTSLMYYFYQKALEEAEEGEVVSEDIFRYPGPKPQSRETAITLLADSVEGATRALDDPSPSNIEDIVKKIVNNKFIDGQLDECPLTLKEIDKISNIFIRQLATIHHGRIKYPEMKNGSKHKQNNQSAQGPKHQEKRASLDERNNQGSAEENKDSSSKSNQDTKNDIQT